VMGCDLWWHGCVKDSAGKFCLDIMPKRSVANVQMEIEDA